jgi:hypothetical protein
MDITKARQLKPGDPVSYPSEDPTKPTWQGRVTLVLQQEQKNFRGVPFLWVHVRNTSLGFNSVWPSNRLT